MKLETATRLHDAARACATLQEVTAGLTEQAFLDDQLRRLAVWKLLEIVGEALRRANETDAAIGERIPDLQRIIDTRNRITHGYDSVNFRMIWRIVEHEIPKLKVTLDTLLLEAPEIPENGGRTP
jgi:uncharacterized protein with HEPN domain